MTATASMFALQGKRALITGSSAGLGHALAVGLAGAGAEIVLNGRNQLRLDEAALALGDAGTRVATLPFDVTSPADTRRAIDRFEAETGPIDILVNATGMAPDQPLGATSQRRLEEVMNTVAHAARHTAEAVNRHMAARGGGCIINVCVTGRSHGEQHLGASAAANDALMTLTREMAAEFGRHNISVNALGLGWLGNAIQPQRIEVSAPNEPDWAAAIPMGRPGRPTDLVGPLIFLASPASGYVTGQILWVDGGLSVAP